MYKRQVAVVSVMTIVTRFTRNLLGREGYLMHTLPVTESQLILSKLIDVYKRQRLHQ